MSYQIVVGVDGSESSERALQWAYEERELRGGELTAVFAWEFPLIGIPGAFDREALEAEALDFLTKEVASVVPDKALVTLAAAQGDPSASLIAACERIGADLLVIGARGRGGFTGLLLGTVGQQCAAHAPCPVLIVKPVKAAAAVDGDAGAGTGAEAAPGA